MREAKVIGDFSFKAHPKLGVQTLFYLFINSRANDIWSASRFGKSLGQVASAFLPFNLVI